MDKTKLKTLFALHLLLVLYSLSAICSKLAANTDFMSFEFIAYYAAIIFLLGLYALGWQQIIKRLPLSTAYANRAVMVIWGIIWGALFFGESITFIKIIGALVVFCGIALFAYADKTDEQAGEGHAENGQAGGEAAMTEPAASGQADE